MALNTLGLILVVSIRQAVSSSRKPSTLCTAGTFRLVCVLCHPVRRALDEDPSSGTSAFQKSRWFIRGWTLQELIAPSTVIFYGADWREIGSKSTLRAVICEITSIHSKLLSGEDNVMDYSFAQRMSWASVCRTTRKGDIAFLMLICRYFIGRGTEPFSDSRSRF
jgi:hypothetical protein